ncbi:MAG: ABC transporter substrate-binding protein [Clostridia bacterium]|nr:ABC transporter substrate-binding protein [Clostridia bacterium]
MKKFLTALLCAIVLAASAVGISACNEGKSGAITVYVPDGAPALAIAQLMCYNADFGKDVEYHVVSSEEITSHVTYGDMAKNADLCVLPVNAASKLLGNGEKYKMLGTVTHGNLYLVSATYKAKIEVATELSGKKVGVVNMAAFPGAVTKLLINKYSVEGVTLEGVAATQVTGVDSQYDYFVIPEPAATTRINNANLNLKLAGSMQQLYGEGGYPQAVLVAKNSLIESEPEFIAQFMGAMESAANWLTQDSVSAQMIFNAVKSGYADPENTTPAFSAANLTKPVIDHCAIRFEKSMSCKQAVKSFIDELKAAGDGAATAVSDNFFYIN